MVNQSSLIKHRQSTTGAVQKDSRARLDRDVLADLLITKDFSFGKILDLSKDFNAESLLTQCGNLIKDREDNVKVKSLSPMIIHSKEVILLPSGFLKSHDESAMAFAAISNVIKYRIRVYESDYKIGDKSEDVKNFFRGIIFAVMRPGDKIAIRAKSNMFEKGRTFARACQVKAVFESRGIQKLLKRSHEFFGNNSGETTGRKTNVTYLKELLPSLFNDKHDAFGDVLFNSLRRSGIFQREELKRLWIYEYSVSYPEYLVYYHSSRILVQNRRAKKSETRTKVPSKPKSKSLFTTEEYDILISIHSRLFNDLEFLEKGETWYDFIYDTPIDKIDRAIEGYMADRNKFLMSFGRITTRRLQEFRKGLSQPSKRKADITSQEVGTCLLLRENLLSSFLDELLSFKTPDVQNFINSVLDSKEGFQTVGIDQESRNLLKNLLMTMGLNKELPYKSAKDYQTVSVTDNLKLLNEKLYPRLISYEEYPFKKKPLGKDILKENPGRSGYSQKSGKGFKWIKLRYF